MVIVGWLSVAQALAFALLQKYHLIEFTGVVQPIFDVLSTTIGVAGAQQLRKAEPVEPK